VSVKPFAAVIFDLDGLLIDTERMAHGAFHYAMSALGHEPSSEFFLSLIGRTAVDSSEMLKRHYGDDFSMDDFRAHTMKHFERELERSGIPVKPGAEGLLDWLSEEEIPYAIATSSASDRARFKIDTAGIGDRFSVIVGGDQVDNGKPAPDIVHRAADELSVSAEDCVVFEDSFNGLMAAHRAGAIPVMVPDLIPPSPDTLDLVHAVLDSLDDGVALLERMRGR
jgi:HAD superfamily hydrolase (TIGR01509 family)